MGYKDGVVTGGVTDRDLPLLSARILRIGKGQSEWIEEDGRRLIKGYTVLPDVGLCLPCIPLVDHRFSLT